MAAKKIAKTSRLQRTATQWHEALQRFANSGLSVQAFCAREGLSVSSFYRRKSAAAAFQDESCAAVQAPAPRRGRSSPGRGFVDLGPLLAPASASMPPALLQLNLRIDLGGGLVLCLERA